MCNVGFSVKDFVYRVLLKFGVNFFFVRKLRLILLLIISGVFLIGIVYFGIGFVRPKAAGLLIETNPTALVFINGEEVGRTPYQEVNMSGEVTVKLVPESFETPLRPYETKITLTPGVETVIRRDFASSDEMSGGDIVSFEKVGKDETSVSIVTIPDGAQLMLDGEAKGFAPYKLISVTPGDHTLLVTIDGYKERSVKIKAYESYKLTAIVTLAKSDEPVLGEEIENPAKDEEPTEKLVEILSTPVGFLRVREEASTDSPEVAQVKLGEEYLLLEEDPDGNWFKIEYKEGSEGWVSSEYAKIKEDDANLTPRPSATPAP